jgi:uncharacterized iron-regulated membrane protein
MKKLLLTLHTWAGLTVGVLVALVGVSGSALVFRADIEQWQERHWHQLAPTAQQLPLEQVIAIAAARIPEREVVRVVLPQQSSEAVEVLLQTRGARNLEQADLIGVFVDPYRGEILGERARARGWVWWLQDLHYTLFGGEPGLKFNGIVAAVLLGLALTGPILWWPGWRNRRLAWRIRARPAAARWRDLHAVSGGVACVALLLICLTALYYAYRSTATATIALLAGTSGMPAPAAPPPAEGSRPALASQLIRAVRVAVPDARLDELRPSRRPGMPVVVSFREPGDFVFGRHKIYLDPTTAAILRIDRHHQLPPVARFLGNMAPWHFGSFGGRVTQWLWFVIGLLPAGLFATGFWLWWRKQRAENRR